MLASSSASGSLIGFVDTRIFVEGDTKMVVASALCLAHGAVQCCTESHASNWTVWQCWAVMVACSIPESCGCRWVRTCTAPAGKIWQNGVGGCRLPLTELILGLLPILTYPHHFLFYKIKPKPSILHKMESLQKLFTIQRFGVRMDANGCTFAIPNKIHHDSWWWLSQISQFISVYDHLLYVIV